ncbi:MAG TPA: hypothetical protein VFW31_13425 [Candidatus Angelobacter sp.]|nr:hypothetical protein [Candidatus Angelobacter sp.]
MAKQSRPPISAARLQSLELDQFDTIPELIQVTGKAKPKAFTAKVRTDAAIRTAEGGCATRAW